MDGLKVLISPLSWGFGHAGRMIPLALALQRRGCEVIFAAYPPLLQMVARELPGIKTVETPGFTIRYSRLFPQYVCIFLQLPVLVASALKEHRMLRRLSAELRPSVVISDNRFGFYSRDICSVYVTHQVRIAFPWLIRWLEPFAAWLHRIIIKRYDLCLVPDYPGEVNLSGRLSHGGRMPAKITYMGPLSRFAGESDDQSEVSTDLPEQYVCLILSGPEPQRSLLLKKVAESLHEFPMAVLSATTADQALPAGRKVHFITAPDTETMRRVIRGTPVVIARAGYTSVMELASLGKGAVLIPTPGQTEQEYLGRYLDGRFGFMTLEQGKLEKLAALVTGYHGQSSFMQPGHSNSSNSSNSTSPAASRPGRGTGFTEVLPDPAPLFERTVDMLLEQKKE